jgi:hypothetical protein
VRRNQLEHLIRAAAAILDEHEILVIGSQFILGSITEDRLPPEATPLDDRDETKSTLLVCRSGIA